MTADARLGTGVAFPPGPVPPRGRWEWQRGPALLRQSIRLILETEPGERVMRPGFGCGLSRYLLAPNTPTVRGQIARDVEAALAAWEPRIVVSDVAVVAGADPSIVLVTVTYASVRDGSADVVEMPFRLAAADDLAAGVG